MKKTVAIIGAGRVGRELGRRLRLLGWRVSVVVTHTPASARAAVRWIGGGKAQTQLSADLYDSELILITVPDRVIAAIAEDLARAGATRWVAREDARRKRASHGFAPTRAMRGSVVLHTSGSLSHDVLNPLSKLGAAIGAMHPMQTFGRGTRPDFRGSVFGLDGDARAVRLGRKIAKALGGTPVEIDARKKAAYHCAGGFAAAHVLAVIEAGIQLLTDVGLMRHQAARSLIKMAHQTLVNLEQRGPTATLSGPLSRGDYSTMARHLEVLRHYPAEYRSAYESLTRLAARAAARDPKSALRELEKVFRKK